MARVLNVYLVFFLSGISGLLYQIVWVRQFGLLFGNTIHSTSLVVAVFMCGLGLGGYFAGRWIDKVYRKDRDFCIKVYAYAEFLIAAFGLLIAVLLIQGEEWSALISSYTLTSNNWYELSWGSVILRYVVATALVFPPTFIMGATLTLLIRYLLYSDLRETAPKVGWLYGINTAGAALGCFLADFVLIPRVGIFSTQMVAVTFNLLAGLGALGIASARLKRLGDSAYNEETLIVQADHPSPQLKSKSQRPSKSKSTPSPSLVIVSSILFCVGFVGLGMEVLWFRFLISSLGQYRSVLSLLLFVILVGIWFGSVASGILTKRLKRPELLFFYSQVVFALFVMGGFLFFDYYPITKVHEDTFFALPALIQPLYEFALILIPILKLVGIPAFVMGFSFPLANALIQDRAREVGKRSGSLYLWNTLGALCGSLLTGFLFIRLLGTKWTLFFMVCLTFVNILLLFPMNREFLLRKKQTALRLVHVVILVALISCLVRWLEMDKDYLLVKSFRNKNFVKGMLEPPHLVTTSEGILESIAIVDIPIRAEGRYLFTNGHAMSSTSLESQRYMRSFVHLSLLQLEKPEDVLVICFGVGNTVHAASLYESVKNLELVDLSKHVLEHAKFFRQWNQDILRDPRVRVFVNDGRQHLRMDRGVTYDLVTLEPPPIGFAGVAALYSKEFYQLSKKKLKKGGFLTQWLPIRQQPKEVILSMIRSFMEVFPNGNLFWGDVGELILMGRKDAENILDPYTFTQNANKSQAISMDLKRISVGNLTDVVGMYLSDSETLSRITRKSPALTDDYPISEYSRILFFRSQIPDIFNFKAVREWCPQCFPGGQPLQALSNINMYRYILESIIRDDSFASYSSYSGTRFGPLNFPPQMHGEIDKTIASSRYLERIFNWKAAR